LVRSRNITETWKSLIHRTVAFSAGNVTVHGIE
jgi:hypothetical protein